jgi:uncharacterized protein
MQVTHEARQGRFLLEHEGTMSVLQYRMAADDVMHMIRTFVAPEFRGGGFGARLVKTALDHARDHGYRVTSSCWFVDAYIEQNPEYADLRA